MRKMITVLILAGMIAFSVSGCESKTTESVDNAEVETTLEAIEKEEMQLEKVPNSSVCQAVSLYEVMDRILEEQGLTNAKDYENGIEDVSKDMIIRLCKSESGKYTAYGFISPEYGKKGIMIDNVIDGQSNWNYFEENWYYGSTRPILEEIDTYEVIFTFTQEKNGTKHIKKICFDTFDTGTMSVREEVFDAEEKYEAGEENTKHREGYTEAALHFYLPKTVQELGVTDAAAFTQENTENRAQEALQELYDLTGTLIDECYYYTADGYDYEFGLTKDDLEHSRIFYSRDFGDGIKHISTMYLSSRRRLWYSTVDMYMLPESYRNMTEEEKAIWFVTHSGLYNGQKVERAYQNYSAMPDTWTIVMENGTAYEISLDSEVDSFGSMAGPYPDSNIQH